MGSLADLAWVRRRYRTHTGTDWLLDTAYFYHADGTQFELIDVSSLFPDVNKNWKRPQSEVTGFAWHHDAVAFSGEDMNFNGHTTDEEFARLSAIYNYHVQQGWNGIGYHAVGGLDNRIFIPRKDVLDTHRAHVSNRNRSLIGFCHMGHYSDSKLPDGTVVARQDDRPPAIAIKGAQAFYQLVTNTLNKNMTLRPHKFYQEKECPGDWATKGSWADVVYRPTPVAAPAVPAPVAGLSPALDVDNPLLWPSVFDAVSNTGTLGSHERLPQERAGYGTYKFHLKY